jgi:hypothetical protein
MLTSMPTSTSGRAASAAAAAATSLGTDTQPILLCCRDGDQLDADARSGSRGAGRWHQRFRLVALHHCTAIPVLSQLRLTTAPSG